MTGFVVTAPLVAVKGADDRIKYLYAGTPVPADVAKEDLDRLAGDGMIVAEDEVKPRVARAKSAKADADE